MKTIWKYKIPNDMSPIMIPGGGRILSAAQQRAGALGDIYVWVLIQDTEAEKVPRRILVFGTGMDIGYSIPLLEHIDTIQTPGGLVSHVFEDISPEDQS